MHAPSSLSATVCTTLNPCTSTTYWVYNTTTNVPIRQLTNNAVTCLAQPYNIEWRPCSSAAPPSLPVMITLYNGTGSAVRSQKEFVKPYFLWGDDPTKGDVFPSKTRLKNGAYRLGSTAGGQIQFTHSCP
jgi:hypothetical protein